ncbi:MAG: S41 family peptidase [Pirellulaceae bacterium]
MRRLLRSPLAAALLTAATLFCPALVRAQGQVLIPAEALQSDVQIQQVLSDGAALEREGRWGEALGHYEDAKKDFPGRREISQRVELARMHLDIARRYSDTTFLTALAASDVNKALDLYGEVLLKIQTHYVHNPDWQGFVDRGARALDVALTEPEFIKRYYGEVAPERLTPVRQELRKLLGSTTVRSRLEARDAVGRAANLVWQRLRLPAQAIVTEYACAAVGALDPYSSFLTAGQLEDVFSQIEGNFVGLGIEIKADEQSLMIVNVIPGGPAARGGLVGGDRIVAVNAASMTEVSTDEAAEMLKGVEGSTVELSVVGEDGVRRQLHLRRERVEVPSVIDVGILDQEQGVGYFRITSFQKTTVRDVDSALWQLHRDGMKSLIVDVRGNPGGLLNASVEIADKFVSAGTIVSTRGRNPREDYDHKAHAIGTWRVPLIVLIDGDSASASEIFAGAIHDHRRGTVVGQRSYGKGSVQGIFPLTGSEAGVRLTTAKFYSPSGQAISDRGVSPDIVVHSVAKPALYGQPVDPQQDPVLKAGMDVARQQLSQR